MSIKQMFLDDGPEISLVQNRLTAAGLILAALFFSGSFSIALYAQFKEPGTTKDYRIVFAQIEVALAIGVCLTLLTIAALLVCQQLSGSWEPWFNSRRWWFAASTIWLYLSLSQAMSAGLTEVVYGLAICSELVGFVIGALAYPIWLLLLFYAPLHLLGRMRTRMRASEHRALLVAYLLPLAVIIGLTAEVYRLQSKEPPGVLVYLGELGTQIGQPLTWWRPWTLHDSSSDQCH